jgi:hypothetical protein
MRNQVNIVLIWIIGLGITSCVVLSNNELVGWDKYVDAAEGVFYHVGKDNQVSYEGKSSGYLTSDNGGEDDFGSLMQSCSAKEFSGHKVNFSAYIKTSDVEQGAGLWFRVDDAEGNVLSFENMQSRPIIGTTDWKKYNIVLDVPNKSARLLYGVLLYQTGMVWIDKVSFSKIEPLKSDTSEIIAFSEEIKVNKKPFNLGFEDSIK